MYGSVGYYVIIVIGIFWVYIVNESMHVLLPGWSPASIRKTEFWGSYSRQRRPCTS